MSRRAIVAALVAVLVAVGAPGAGAQAPSSARFDGTYGGAFTGRLGSGAAKGEVKFTVTAGAIAVTQPVSGAGTVGASGAATFGGTVSGLGFVCTFTGTFTAQGTAASAKGDWSCGRDGAGTWDAARTSTPATVPSTVPPTVPPTTPSSSVPGPGPTTTGPPPAGSTVVSNGGPLTVRHADGTEESSTTIRIVSGDRISTPPGTTASIQLPGNGAVTLSPNSTVVVTERGVSGSQKRYALTGITGEVRYAPGNVGAGTVLATSATPGSTAYVDFPDGSKVQLGLSGTFQLTDNQASSRRLGDFIGTLKAFVTKLGTRRFEVRSTNACACVRGTEFTVTATKDATTVRTTSGSVAFSNSRGKVKTVLVNAGQTSTVKGSSPPSKPKRG